AAIASTSPPAGAVFEADPAHAAPPAEQDSLTAQEPLAAQTDPADQPLQSELPEDDGFLESLLGDVSIALGASDHEALSDLLIASPDPILSSLLAEDPAALLADDAASEDLLGDLLGLVRGLDLGGALARPDLLAAMPDGPGLGAADPEVDALLNEILDSG